VEETTITVDKILETETVMEIVMVEAIIMAAAIEWIITETTTGQEITEMEVIMEALKEEDQIIIIEILKSVSKIKFLYFIKKALQ
jgi:hypothetical protein